MYSTPNRPSPRIRPRQVPEGPIHDFTTIIEHTPSDSWQKRASAFQELVDAIPHGSAYAEGGMDWYNTPAMLRHLAFPISELLKDARSTVVKRVCESLTLLFMKCQVDARYLLKDLMISILAVHAQTVHIIRQSVQNMVVEIIPEVPCKMVMPLWMERLKSDKSRTVREACALYLGRALQCWTEEGYLTNEIWMQVGSTLLRSLRDPSPHVRSYAKLSLEYIQRNQPHHWEALVNDPTGPAVKDFKLQKWLRSLEQSGTAAADMTEELSIASKFSYNSDTRFANKSNLRISSPRVKLTQNESGSGDEKEAVPFSIAVTHRQRTGPPLPTARPVQTPFPQAMSNSPLPPRVDGPSYNAPIQTPQRPATLNTDVSRDLNKKIETELEYSQSENADGDKIYFEGKDPSTPIHVDEKRSEASPLHFASNNLNLADGSLILSTEDLRQHAARRRSQSSLLMQERFRKSNSRSLNGNGIQEEDETSQSDLHGDQQHTTEVQPKQIEDVPSSLTSPGSDDNSPSLARPPEHMVIAIRLLRAHKSHVDQIMETLKIEMDTLRDFDRLLEEPGRPTEEEVINYFESVGLCLDQRLSVGRELQREMDRISRGEPPEL